MIGLSTRLSKALLSVLVCILALSVFVVSLPTEAANGKSDLVTIASEKQKRDPVLVLTIGTADVVRFEGNISDVMVANASIVEAEAIKANTLYINGLNLGSTNIITLDEEGNVLGRLTVHVKIDSDPIQKLIEKLYPNEEVEVTALEQQVILSGTVSTPEMANRIANMVAHYIGDIVDLSGSIDDIIANNLTVRGTQQVMLRLRVVEISRTLLREVGNDTHIDDIGDLLGDEISNSPFMNLDNGRNVFSAIVGGARGTATPLARIGANVSNLGAFGPIDMLLSVLEEDGFAKILAEPNLTAVSGQAAGFLAGGEFPVPGGLDQQGNLIIEFREFGVSLNFVPRVLSDDRLSIQMDTEVSSISSDTQVTLQSVTVPGLDIRRASTTVELGSGGTLMIAGLLQSQTVKNMSNIPGMRGIPILGDLMASDSFRRDETELILLLSPFLVEPFAEKTERVKEMPKPRKEKALAKAFEANIRRVYGKLSIDKVFGDEQVYGYLLD